MISEYLIEMAEASFNIVNNPDPEYDGRKNWEIDGKLVCQAEKDIYDAILLIANEKIPLFILESENFKEFRNSPYRSNYIITLDEIDGTAYYARQRSKNPPQITTMISAINSACYGTPTYSNVVAALIIDLITGEMWYVEDNKTISSEYGDCNTGGNEEHDPVWLTDFYFNENAKMRELFNNPENPELKNFEFLNTGSMVGMGAKVANGEADALIHVVGPKGYELSAMYPIVKNAGGHSIDLRTGNELGKTEFNFVESVPVVMAKDKTLAEEIYHQIKMSESI